MIVGISADATADNKAFREKFGFPYDLLSDTDMAMSVAYGAATDGAARPGRISVLIGPAGTVAATYPNVSPADHPSEVLQTLGELS